MIYRVVTKKPIIFLKMIETYTNVICTLKLANFMNKITKPIIYQLIFLFFNICKNKRIYYVITKLYHTNHDEIISTLNFKERQNKGS